MPLRRPADHTARSAGSPRWHPSIAIARDGDLHAQAHARLGVALHQLGQLEAAITSPRDTAIEQLKGAVLQARQDLRHATGLVVHADPTIDTFADIDNLATHLAGALGQRTWLLIDSRLDWRWGLDDSETLWYPNARLFRQSAAGDWATPLQAVQEELERLRREGAGAAAGRTPPPGKWVF